MIDDANIATSCNILCSNCAQRHIEILVEVQVGLCPLSSAMEFLVETHHPKPGQGMMAANGTICCRTSQRKVAKVKEII